MTERMDRDRLRYTGLILGRFKNLLNAPGGKGFIRVLAGEKKISGLKDGPIMAKEKEIFLTQYGKSVLPALTAANSDQHIFGINICAGKIKSLTNSKTGRIDSKQGGFMLKIRIKGWNESNYNLQ